MSVHSASAMLAPEGGALIHTIRYLKPGEHYDPKAVEHELEALLNRLQPGWQREVVERQFLPHLNATTAILMITHPAIVDADPLVARQDANRIDGLFASLGMQAVMHQVGGATDMEPLSFAGNVQARLVVVQKRTRVQSGFDGVLRALQSLRTALHGQEQSALRQATAQHVREQFTGASRGQEVIVRQVGRSPGLWHEARIAQEP